MDGKLDKEPVGLSKQEQIDRKLLNYIDDKRDQMIEHVRKLVRIDSVEREAREGAPFGPGVKEALELALAIGREL